MLKYLPFWLASKLVPVLPVNLTYGLAWMIASIGFYVARKPKQAVASNLRRVLGPEADAQALGQAVRGVFRTISYNYADMFLIPRVPPAELVERTTIKGLDLLLDSYAQGKGLIITTAHLGNFDLLIQVSQACNIPVTVLVERLSPEPLFQLVSSLRGSHGVRLVPLGPHALREVLRVLRSGGAVAVTADRHLQGRGTTVSFFGEETRLPTGAIDLALRTGATLLPCFGLRLPGHRYQITIEQPLELDRECPEAEIVAQNLRRLVSILERYIGEHPEQWMLFEPVWRSNTSEHEQESQQAARIGAGR